MRVEQVMFRSGPVRCAGDLYLPDGVDAGAPAPGETQARGLRPEYRKAS
jgi:hypothetical protein